MKNTKNKRGQKHSLWQTLNKAKTLLIEENYKNGILHRKRTDIYKGDWVREQFYMNGQLFGETLRNDKILIQKFHEIIDDGEWKIDKREFPHSKFWFVDGKCMLEYNEKYKTIYIAYDGFWSIFESPFIMDFGEDSNFIQHQVEEHFKLKIIATFGGVEEEDNDVFGKMEEHFKLKADYKNIINKREQKQGNLRNDKPLIQKFHEIIDGGEWKIDKKNIFIQNFGLLAKNVSLKSLNITLGLTVGWQLALRAKIYLLDILISGQFLNLNLI